MGLLEGHGRQVGGQDSSALGQPRLLEQDGQRVGLLARGAAGAPQAQPVPGGTEPLQRREDLLADHLPLQGLAEEVGLSHGQLDDQVVEIGVPAVQPLQIGRHVGPARAAHGPADAGLGDVGEECPVHAQQLGHPLVPGMAPGTKGAFPHAGAPGEVSASSSAALSLASRKVCRS